MEKFTIELIVANRYGVLNRITGLYARRGYNIDSLNVNRGDAYIQTQMVRQLSKLYDVKEVTLMATVNFKQ